MEEIIEIQKYRQKVILEKIAEQSGLTPYVKIDEDENRGYIMRPGKSWPDPATGDRDLLYFVDQTHLAGQLFELMTPLQKLELYLETLSSKK